jgi:hypothetical protein
MAVKNSITPIDLTDINPLIDSNGRSHKISSVLVALSDMFKEEENRAMEHDSEFGFGIALMLDVCAAALRQMEKLPAGGNHD